MKIAVIGPTYPYKGGISHFTTILVKTLRKKSTVNFISWKRQYPAFLYPVGLKDTQSKNPITTDAKFLLDFFNPFSWVKTAMDIKNNHADILIITWVSPIQAPIYFLIGKIIKLSTSTRIIFICHNILPHESTALDKLFTKIAFSQSDIFIVHAAEDKEKLRKILEKNKKIITGFHPIYDVFNSGKNIDIKKIKHTLHLKERVLLFFGYIRPYKGLLYLIQALPEVLKSLPKTTLLVAGEFWSKDKQLYLNTIKNLRLENNIVMVNKYIPNEEVAHYFAVADVVVLPYISATQSGITQIAIAFNKPIISTEVGGLKDISQTDHRLTIKPKNPHDIAQKIIKFYRNPNLYESTPIKRESDTWEEYINLIIQSV